MRRAPALTGLRVLAPAALAPRGAVGRLAAAGPWSPSLPPVPADQPLTTFSAPACFHGDEEAEPWCWRPSGILGDHSQGKRHGMFPPDLLGNGWVRGLESATLLMGSRRLMPPGSSRLARDFPEVLRNNEGRGASRGGMCGHTTGGSLRTVVLARDSGSRAAGGSWLFRDPAPWQVHCLLASRPPEPSLVPASLTLCRSKGSFG